MNVGALGQAEELTVVELVFQFLNLSVGARQAEEALCSEVLTGAQVVDGVQDKGRNVMCQLLTKLDTVAHVDGTAPFSLLELL